MGTIRYRSGGRNLKLLQMNSRLCRLLMERDMVPRSSDFAIPRHLHWQ
jgi:hypothetical protein